MKWKLPVVLVLMLGCLAVAMVFSARASFDGITPPHAVDTDGKTVPESSATPPDKPIILSKDIHDEKYGELRPEAAFDHTKHNTDVMHTLDGKTLTGCVYCHHTEQPMPVAGQPYLKKSERSDVLTSAQLETSKQAVNSCRKCHFQKSTPATDEFPPKSVRYPRELAKQIGMMESGELTNDNAYHNRCITCHDLATKRDSTLKAPTGCPECHIKKSASTATATPIPSISPTTTPTTMTATPSVTP